MAEPESNFRQACDQLEGELDTAMLILTLNSADSTAAPDIALSDEIIALRSQLEDLKSLQQDANFTQPTPSFFDDHLVALRCQLENFRTAQLIQADQRMQQSIYRAMLADTAAVENVLVDGSVSGPNSQAMRIDGQDGYYEDPRIDSTGNTQLDEYVNDLKLDESHPPQTCPTCWELIRYSQGIEVGSCSHRWCRACLTAAFEQALQNEDQYPVRCCKDLPIISIEENAVGKTLGDTFVADLRRKVVEYTTDNRTYCHQPGCSAFIVPDTIQGRLAVCPSCQTRTCSTCKQAYHVQDECQAVQDRAFDEWRTANDASVCPRCHRTIIISHGCNHMS